MFASEYWGGSHVCTVCPTSFHLTDLTIIVSVGGMIPETKGCSLGGMFFFFLVICSTYRRTTEISDAGVHAYLERPNTINGKDDEILMGRPGANTRIAR